MPKNFMIHSGAFEVSRAELSKIEAPEPTETWLPIKHYDLLVAVEEGLKRKKIHVTKEHLAVQRKGMFFFGVLDLKSQVRGAEYTSALGLRSSNNKIVAIQMAVGARVFVCDNLMFHGDLIALKKKHTSGLFLEDEIDAALNVFANKFDKLSHEINKMKKYELNDIKAKTIMFDLFVTKKIMPIRLLDDVAKEYFNPTHKDFSERTLWSLQNSFTYVARTLPEAPRWLALRALGAAFNSLLK